MAGVKTTIREGARTFLLVEGEIRQEPVVAQRTIAVECAPLTVMLAVFIETGPSHYPTPGTDLFTLMVRAERDPKDRPDTLALRLESGQFTHLEVARRWLYDIRKGLDLFLKPGEAWPERQSAEVVTALVNAIQVLSERVQSEQAAKERALMGIPS